jgi:hypothetical protein
VGRFLICLLLVSGCARSSNFNGGDPDAATDGAPRDARRLDASPDSAAPDSTTNDSRADSVAAAQGLVLLYLFDEGSGTVVKDRATLLPLLDLHISEPAAVAWQTDGLAVQSATVIQSAQAAKKLAAACKKSNEVSLEVWITPGSGAQAGPARIATISESIFHRNLTLGQEGSSFIARIRTTSNGPNGLPQLKGQTGKATTKPTHVVFTRTTAGVEVLYVDGTLDIARTTSGDLSSWDDTFHLALAKELDDQNPWLGIYHRVAIFDRALDAASVKQRFQAGP